VGKDVLATANLISGTPGLYLTAHVMWVYYVSRLTAHAQGGPSFEKTNKPGVGKKTRKVIAMIHKTASELAKHAVFGLLLHYVGVDALSL